MNRRSANSLADISEKTGFSDCTDGKVTKYTIMGWIWWFTLNTHMIPNYDIYSTSAPNPKATCPARIQISSPRMVLISPN